MGEVKAKELFLWHEFLNNIIMVHSMAIHFRSCHKKCLCCRCGHWLLSPAIWYMFVVLNTHAHVCVHARARAHTHTHTHNLLVFHRVGWSWTQRSGIPIWFLSICSFITMVEVYTFDSCEDCITLCYISDLRIIFFNNPILYQHKK